MHKGFAPSLSLSRRQFLAAAGISWVVTVLTPITMTITVGYILLAIGVSTAVGMIAGIYPAFKASRLDPIIALTRS